MSVGVTKDYKLKVRNLHASHIHKKIPPRLPFFFLLPKIKVNEVLSMKCCWCLGGRKDDDANKREGQYAAGSIPGQASMGGHRACGDPFDQVGDELEQAGSVLTGSAERTGGAIGAIYVKLPWDGPPTQWAALQATLPSWPDGSNNEQENIAMMQWMSANRNITVAIQTSGDLAVRTAYMELMKRILTEARTANIIFGMKKIERLTQHRESTVTSAVVLHQNEILTLMSCALFDFFPHSGAKEHEHIGLTRIFRFMTTRTESYGLEKTRCILNYLRMAETDRGGTRQVSFKRHIARFPEKHWTDSAMQMRRCTWHDVRSDTGDPMKIEDVCDQYDGQAWEVDFANSSIGGGVTGSGCVQEEIRFMQCPELLVSILFTDRFEADESLQITGYRQFNETRGYGRLDDPVRFQYVNPDGKAEPSHGRSMLVMDATYYGENERYNQFRWDDIKRELNKARCAFDYSENAAWPIVTGHWGCGAFHGDHRLKLYIQLLAAAEAGKRVEYCNFNDKRGAETRAFMESIPENVPVGRLYKRLREVVMQHNGDYRYYSRDYNRNIFFHDVVMLT